MLRNPELRAAVDEKPLVRISFELPPTEQAGSETLWAEKLDDGMYKLRNTPLLVEGLSYDDTVEAELDEAGILKFKKVLGRGGHSTYRIMVRSELSPTQADDLKRQLLALGASVESQTPRLFALDVPPRTNIFDAYSILQQGLDNGIWWFDEMHVGHQLI